MGIRKAAIIAGVFIAFSCTSRIEVEPSDSDLVFGDLATVWDEAMPLGKKCHRANRYDGASMASAKFAACDAAIRSDGYDPRRSEHRMKRR